MGGLRDFFNDKFAGQQQTGIESARIMVINDSDNPPPFDEVNTLQIYDQGFRSQIVPVVSGSTTSPLVSFALSTIRSLAQSLANDVTKRRNHDLYIAKNGWPVDFYGYHEQLPHVPGLHSRIRALPREMDEPLAVLERLGSTGDLVRALGPCLDAAKSFIGYLIGLVELNNSAVAMTATDHQGEAAILTWVYQSPSASSEVFELRIFQPLLDFFESSPLRSGASVRMLASYWQAIANQLQRFVEKSQHAGNSGVVSLRTMAALLGAQHYHETKAAHLLSGLDPAIGEVVWLEQRPSTNLEDLRRKQEALDLRLRIEAQDRAEERKREATEMARVARENEERARRNAAEALQLVEQARAQAAARREEDMARKREAEIERARDLRIAQERRVIERQASIDDRASAKKILGIEIIQSGAVRHSTNPLTAPVQPQSYVRAPPRFSPWTKLPSSAGGGLTHPSGPVAKGNNEHVASGGRGTGSRNVDQNTDRPRSDDSASQSLPPGRANNCNPRIQPLAEEVEFKRSTREVKGDNDNRDDKRKDKSDQSTDPQGSEDQSNRDREEARIAAERAYQMERDERNRQHERDMMTRKERVQQSRQAEMKAREEQLNRQIQWQTAQAAWRPCQGISSKNATS